MWSSSSGLTWFNGWTDGPPLLWTIITWPIHSSLGIPSRRRGSIFILSVLATSRMERSTVHGRQIFPQTKSKSGRVLDDIEPATSELSWGKHSGTQWLDRMCHVNIIWTCIKYKLCQKKNNVWKTINNHQPSVFLFSSMPPISVFHRSSPPCSWETRRFGLSFPGPGCHAKHRAEVSQRNMVTWCIPSSFNPFQASFGIKHGSNTSPREFQGLVTKPLVMEKSRQACHLWMQGWLPNFHWLIGERKPTPKSWLSTLFPCTVVGCTPNFC